VTNQTPLQAPVAAGLRSLLQLKRRLLRHHLRAFFRQSLVGPLAAFGMGVFFSVGGLGLFLSGLHFLNSFPTVGPLIVDRILILFFVTLMVMLTFSATLVSFSTIYKSEESAFLWSLPFSPLEVFHARTAEAVSLSSWAFVVLGGPMLLCWGAVTGASSLFYVMLPVVLVPFTLLCGLFGALLTVLLAYAFPRLSWKSLGAIVAVAAVASGGYVLAAFSPWNVHGDDAFRVLNRLLSGLQNLQSPLAPSHWAFAGLSRAASGEVWPSIRYALLLWVNVLALDLLLRRVVPSLLFPGYSALSRATRIRRRSVETGAVAWLGRRLGRLDPVDRALVLKDVRLFWRDPSQWSQFLLFTVLMLVYTGNVRQMPSGIRAPEWINILHFLNLMACALLLATLTARFIYPLVSLEGKTFWVVGLAPIRRRRVLRQKLLLSLGTTLLFGEGMTFATSMLLGVPGRRVALFCAVILVMNLTLSCLAVGLAALFPDFKEDNPSKIVNGAGGLINFFVSIAYTLVVVLTLATPYHLHVTGRLGEEGLRTALLLGGAGLLLLSAGCAVLPLLLGIRKLERFEF
jgi:ABC-2 type transport system permease protein